MADLKGTFKADFSPFLTAVQNAQVTLRSFEDGAGKAGQAVTKMANSLQGTSLIQQAAVMEEAVKRLGGEGGVAAGLLKLTDQELARVSSTAQEAAAKLKAMGQDVPPGIQKIADAGKASSNVFGDLASQVKATALGFVSAQAIIGAVQAGFRTLTAFIGESIESYASAEAAAKKMTTALQAQGTATPAVIQQFNDLASQFQKTTVYSDDLINEMEALLTSVGDVAPGQMDKALKAATDLASGLGIDLHTATLMVAKASEENVAALKKAGVQLDETRVKAEGMSYILDVVSSKFGGQAQSEINTYAGQIKQLANEWDNFKEAVGKAIVEDPLVQDLLRHIREGIQGASDEAGKGTKTISEWWAAISGDVQSQIALANMREVAALARDVNAELSRLGTPATPKAFVPQGDPFAVMMADAKKQSEALIAQWQKEDEAAKQHAAAFKSMFDKFSGADAARQMQLLDQTFRALAASGQLTKTQIDAIVKEALKLSEQGAKVTPRLWDMVQATNALSPGLNQNALDFSKLGEQIAIIPPKVDKVWEMLNKPPVEGIANLRQEFSNLLVVTPETMLKGVLRDTIDTDKAIGELAQAFAQLGQIASGSLGDIVRSFGTLVSAINTANKSTDTFKTGLKGFKDGDLLGGVLDMTSGILGMASAAIAAGKAIAGLFDRNKGRDLVVDFAETFGGFDQLHAQLLELGDEGERLWIALTQGVGRNNPKEAQAAIDAVTKALEKKKATFENSTIATEEDAQATIETAAAAAKALDDVNDRLKVNVEAWSEWSEDVTGFLQKLADEIRAMPIPSPVGPSYAGGGSATYKPPPAGTGGGSPAFSADVKVPLYLDSNQVAEGVVRVTKLRGLR